VAVVVGFRGEVIDCNGRLLARDETEKDALDRVELDGVDERVGAAKKISAPTTRLEKFASTLF